VCGGSVPHVRHLVRLMGSARRPAESAVSAGLFHIWKSVENPPQAWIAAFPDRLRMGLGIRLSYRRTHPHATLPAARTAVKSWGDMRSEREDKPEVKTKTNT